MRVDDRLVGELIERELPCVAVNRRLYGVAHVVHPHVRQRPRRATVRLVAELVVAAVGIRIRIRQTVHLPDDAPARDDGKRVTVVVKERRDPLQTLDRGAVVVDPRLVVDELAEDNLEELAALVAEYQAFEQRVDAHTGVDVLRKLGDGAAFVGRIVELLHVAHVAVRHRAGSLAVVHFFVGYLQRRDLGRYG